MAALPPLEFGTVAIVGVGLIGGSLGTALRQRKKATVLGVGRDTARLEEARRRGIIDRATIRLSAAAGDADLLVFCTPVDRIVEGVREAAAHARPGTLITDAGSVKGALCAPLTTGLPAGVEFLGSHPMAGSEKQGFEHADPDLFVNRLCLITPAAHTTVAARARLKQFWEAVGMRTLEMSPAEHDVAVAEASHLPHLVAATLASTLRPEHRPVAATGFRDTTRVASGDPGLWTAILLANADAVLESLERQTALAARFRDALRARDETTLHQLLSDACQARESV